MMSSHFNCNLYVLDLKAELTPLDITESQIKKKADEDLAKLRRDEETK
jgi:hypothetical protein